MKNASKKLVTLLAMLTLVLGMSVQTVMADNTNTIGPNSSGKAETTETTLNIVKTLTVKNPALIQVAGPGLQYSFEVSTITISEPITITDGDGHTATVHAGPSGGLTLTSSPAFSVDQMLTASAAGTDNTGNIVLAAHLDQFTEPGIYRFKLTDTTSDDALAAAGVDRVSDYTDDRYVDVYIQVTSTGELAVEGYVVGSDIDGNGILVKETFDTSTTNEDETAAGYKHSDTRDKFDTYNLQLNKTVTGAMGDKNHEFPFAIVVSEQDREYYAAKGTAPTSSSELNVQPETASLSTSLKHGEIYYIAGLRKNSTVTYTETNNTSDTYKTSITGGTPSAASAVAPGATKAMSATNAPDAATVTFVNNHDSVSPTGVLMRFGPYIGMVIVAVLLIMMRKRAKTNR